MSEEILVRLLPDSGDSLQHADASAVTSLPIPEAAEKIAAGQAEPIIEIHPHAPTLPDAGVSIAEAFRLFVAQHPDVLSGGGVNPRFSSFQVRQYTDSPNWAKTVAKSRLRELAGLERRPQMRGDTWLGGRASDWWGDHPRIIQTDELARGFIDLRTKYVLTIIIHGFLKQLQDNVLLAKGVPEGNLPALEKSSISSDWWLRDIVVYFRMNEIRERTLECPRPGVRRWSAVGVMLPKAELQDADSRPGQILKTGAPGRPTSMHLIRRELYRRANTGRLSDSLRAEADKLLNWLVSEHPEAPLLTRKTIENNIRAQYRKLKASGEPSQRP